MSNIDHLLESIRTALDPERFFQQLQQSGQGKSFLNGDSDSVTLTRRFLDDEAAVARRGIDALEALSRTITESVDGA